MYLGVTWSRLFFPAYPTLFVALVGWRQRLRVTVLDTVAAVTAVAFGLAAQQYCLSQSPPELKARRSWAGLGASVTMDRDGRLLTISFNRKPRLDRLKDQISLREISLGPHPVRHEDLNILATLPSLRKITLMDKALTEENLREVAKLVNLESVSISGEPITTDGFRAIGGLPRLKHLSIYHMPLSVEGCRALSRAEQLEEICAFQTTATDEGIKHFGRLKALRDLDVGRSAVTGACFCGSGFTALEEVMLERCPVDEAGLRCIASLPKVRYIAHVGGPAVPRAVIKKIVTEHREKGRELKIE